MGDRINWKMGHWDKSHYVSHGKRGYWSKYGGGDTWREPIEMEWSCQSCGREQVSILPSFPIPINDSENARICGFCKHISLLKQVSIVTELITFVRFSNAIANLLSLPLAY